MQSDPSPTVSGFEKIHQIYGSPRCTAYKPHSALINSFFLPNYFPLVGFRAFASFTVFSQNPNLTLSLNPAHSRTVFHIQLWSFGVSLSLISAFCFILCMLLYNCVYTFGSSAHFGISVFYFRFRLY